MQISNLQKELEGHKEQISFLISEKKCFNDKISEIMQGQSSQLLELERVSKEKGKLELKTLNLTNELRQKDLLIEQLQDSLKQREQNLKQFVEVKNERSYLHEKLLSVNQELEQLR